MKKIDNSVHIEGRVYDSSKLAFKTTGPHSKNPGTTYIGGSLDIATDEEGVNIVTWTVTYVVPKTSSGGVSRNYTTLSNIINSGKTWVNDGKDEATCVSINAALAVNDFYTSKAGQDEVLVSAKRIEGGFISVIKPTELLEDEEKRAWFNIDAVLNSVKEFEANEERDIPAYVSVHGATFNYKNDLIPFDMTVESPNGMKYFLDLDISNANQVFTKIQGPIVSKDAKREVRMESAFGETFVKMVPFKQKKWLITWAAPTPYLFDDDSTITLDELKEAAANREVHLAEVKKSQDDYRASQAQAAAATMAPPAMGDFKF